METKLMWGEGVDFVIYERPLMEKSPDRVSWIASMREKEPVTITQALKLEMVQLDVRCFCNSD